MIFNNRNIRLSELTIAELACNRSLEEIQDLHDLLRQSIRSYLSRILYKTDIDTPLECNIKIFPSESLCKEKVCISFCKIWQDSIEGIITLNAQDESFDLDDLVLEDQIYLLESLIHD